VGKPEEKRPQERPGRRWVDNIRMDLREIRWDGMDWIDLAQDRDQWRALVNTVMNLFHKMLEIDKKSFKYEDDRRLSFVISSCSFERAQSLRGTYRFHLQGIEINPKRIQ
jgi:hypothetical protein